MTKNHKIQVYEYDRLIVGDEGFRLQHLNALLKLNEYHDGKYFEPIATGIKFSQYVGVIQIDGLIIEILPKADKDEPNDRWQGILLKMLVACGKIKANTAGAAHVKHQHLNLLEVYFELFLSELSDLIHKGLVKQYRKESKNVKALKGKLEFAQNIRHNLVHKERFYTQHQVYDTQHLLHLVLSKALEIVERFTRSTRLYDHCRRVMLDFPEMKNGNVTAKQISSIVLNRKTAPYGYALELARLIILNYSPDISHGQEKMLSLLFDMNQLWEEFVLIQLSKYLENKPKYNLFGQDSKPFWGSISLRPDIVVKQGKDIYIIDTKWKRPGNSSASISDLRQMYAYCRFWNAKKAVLIYPGENDQRGFVRFENSGLDGLEHQCKMGFVSVLGDEAKTLSKTVGEDVWGLLEVD